MATNPMQRKSRNSFILGVLITMLIMGAIVAFLFYNISQMKENEKKRLANSVTVYALKEDVSAGDKIYADMLDSVVVSGTSEKKAATTTIDKNILKKDESDESKDKEGNPKADYIAKIDIKKGTIITNEQIQDSNEEITSDLRMQEYNMLKLTSQIKTGDYIDVRLRMPSGLDYIVVSKKKIEIPEIEGIESADTIWLKMTEQETLAMSNAIVEAYIMEGSVLYVTLYTEPGLQEGATPTYVPTEQVQQLIVQNPNVESDAKNALKTRYENYGALRTVTNNELSQYSDNALDNIESGVADEIKAMQDARQAYLDALAGN